MLRWQWTRLSHELQGDYVHRSFERSLWNVPKINKEIRKITTCDRLEWETLGFWPIMPRIAMDTAHIYLQYIIGWRKALQISHKFWILKKSCTPPARIVEGAGRVSYKSTRKFLWPGHGDPLWIHTNHSKWGGTTWQPTCVQMLLGLLIPKTIIALNKILSKYTFMFHMPWLDHIFIQLGPAPPTSPSLPAWSSCPHLHGNSFS